MKKEIIDYRIPTSINEFQEKMYKHLIDWKWKNIDVEDDNVKYDTQIPKSVRCKLPFIYEPVQCDLLKHNLKYHFKFHIHFNHVASSQAANINLFLPILLSSKANEILKSLKLDFKSLATDYLYKGFRLGFWDGNSNSEKGLLGDHNARSGTDADIAIAYYNEDDKLCLWLIEHKLTEKEFSNCGGYKSDTNKCKSNCLKSFDEILKNKDYCYYHKSKKFNYWKITEQNKSFFENHEKFDSCPFKGGMNQLWRNQLLAFAIEQDKNQPYEKVFFSVVHHPENNFLDKTINEYKKLINNNSDFTSFTAKDVVDAASEVKDDDVNRWIEWYCDLYSV